MFTPISFDIETTGLAADDEVISVAIYDPEISDHGDDVISRDNDTTESQVLQALYIVFEHMPPDIVLITFNGSNYKYGFDFPFLRTRFAKHNISWPFRGRMHIDLYPIIERHWNTSVMPEPSLDRLRKKEQIMDVACCLGIGDVNPKATIAEMTKALRELRCETDIVQAIIATQDIKPVATNTLKSAYQIITGKDPGDMDGKECVHLWEQYKASGDESILQRIREYNLNDCKITLELFEICREYCSVRGMKPEVL